MNEASKKPSVQQPLSYAKERTAFKAMLLANPNYFGNLVGSQFKPVLPLCCNQHYETLKDVGYHPQQKRLEAVVHINQPSGYSGDVCADGSAEYVRFYLSFDNGNSWEDQGLTSFQAYDVKENSDGRHLEYAVSLPVNPKRRFCFLNPLIKVRAILSWNYPPPENQPAWKPVWGNVILEKDILVEPLRKIIWQELFKAHKIELPLPVKEMLDPDEPVVTKQKVLNAAELAAEYANKGVPLHRFAFKELHDFVSSKTNLSAEAVAELMPGLKVDSSIADLLFPKTDGDTSYEELMSLGLDPNCPDTLVGVIKVKKMSGYSGGPCTQGSHEHVTFWADFDGGGFETCLGTASVQAYDIDSPEQSVSPQDGVWYAVRLPVDLAPYRRHCKKGPNVVRIRAILSWNVPVPCDNPDYVPAWGNREETHVCIGPKAGDASRGKIGILGGIPVSMIDYATGLTTKAARFATNNSQPDPHGGRPCPFGGRVAVQGAPLLEEGFSYKVEVVPQGGGAATAVVTDLLLTRADGTTWTHKADPTTGRFKYVPFADNINGLLAQWDSTGDQLWTVCLASFDASGSQVGASDEHKIQLDNTAPQADIFITSGAGDCGKFKVGDVIEGRFAAHDYVAGQDSLLYYQISVMPDVNHPAIYPDPSLGFVNTVDHWQLKTVVETIVQPEKMQPCGYVVRVDVWDRAIVNSQWVGHYASASVGFCLEK